MLIRLTVRSLAPRVHQRVVERVELVELAHRILELRDVDVFAVNNFGDTRSGGLAGPMGLFIIVLMSIATVLLIRNMNKRLRRLPDSFTPTTERERVAEIARLNADGTPDATFNRGEGVKLVSFAGAPTRDAKFSSPPRPVSAQARDIEERVSTLTEPHSPHTDGTRARCPQ